MARRAPARRRCCASQWRADFKVFFDVSVEEEPVGRLVFAVQELDSLARSTKNFKAITNIHIHRWQVNMTFNVAAHALSLPCTSLRLTEKMFVVLDTRLGTC